MDKLLFVIILTYGSPQLQASADPQQAALDATIAIMPNTGARGSGIVIGTTQDSTTFALTARHVVAKANGLSVLAMVVGVPTKFTAQVVWEDEQGQTDLALISFPSKDYKIAAAILGDREKHREDFPIFKTSWKEGSSPIAQSDRCVKRVLVKAVDKPSETEPGKHSAFYWQTKGKSEQGESGGGMFDMDGALLGICSGYRHEYGYFTHRDEIYFATRKHTPAALKSVVSWLK